MDWDRKERPKWDVRVAGENFNQTFSIDTKERRVGLLGEHRKTSSMGMVWPERPPTMLLEMTTNGHARQVGHKRQRIVASRAVILQLVILPKSAVVVVSLEVQWAVKPARRGLEEGENEQLEWEMEWVRGQ